jgi:hypothetical protein
MNAMKALQETCHLFFLKAAFPQKLPLTYLEQEKEMINLNVIKYLKNDAFQIR